jgi:colanic acid/amylovoran biosynthesis glycosyltransferase
MARRIGYIIPEFPGQTHIWMWREIVWMRRWLGELHIYSTRQPPERDWARHAFVAPAMKFTTYLWPAPVWSAVRWAMMRHPIGFVRCIALCFTLPIEKRPRFVHLLKLLPSACFLAEDAAGRGIEQLHSQSCANSAVLGMMVKRLVGIPYSLTINADIDWWGGAMREKFSEAEFTMTHTKWVLEEIRRRFPELGENQAIRGSIGVDTASWTPALRRPRDMSESQAFRIITVGRLTESKGHDTLLAAVEQLIKEGRDITLRLIGEGPQRKELEDRASSLIAGGRAKFLGSLAEHQIQAEMRSADAFVLASHSEALGVVYMEAMAAGVPTIGTSAGGVGEIITSEEDGLLVPPKDVEALAAAIVRLMDDPQLCRRLAENARATIVRRFDSRIGAAILYTRITGEQPPAAVEFERRSA